MTVTVAAVASIVIVVERCAGVWVLATLCGAWLLAGVTLFDAGWFHPRRDLLAAAFGLRRPVAGESDALSTAWANLSQRPGVDGWGYSLWIQQSPQINAYAGPARLVAVTSWAVGTLPPRELEAVLAHEYGHHIVSDARLRLLEAWISAPVRLAQRLGTLPGRLVTRRATGPIATAVRYVSAVLILAVAAWSLTPAAGWPATAMAVLLGVEPLATAARRRRAELRADAIAVHLGYRHELADALLRRQRPTGTEPAAPFRRWFDDHPPIPDRLRAMTLPERGRQGPASP
ncbi:M48 family metalloprotease [Nocardia inohanensis]|uniref:M48 family metalloprotease n=1 Tax=Nocardia inohanensis TaxID=209246 RepID=UPI0008296913|nr:M48 family metalloprotease [Nocardia inohanensis]